MPGQRPTASGETLSVEDLLALHGQPTMAEIARSNVRRIKRTEEEMRRVERELFAAEEPPEASNGQNAHRA